MADRMLRGHTRAAAEAGAATAEYAITIMAAVAPENIPRDTPPQLVVRPEIPGLLRVS